MTKSRIFIADEHPILRAGLRVVLGAESDMVVVGESADGASVVASVAACRANIVLIDVKDGLEVTTELLRNDAGVHVIAFSAHDEPCRVDEMLAAGARGYVVKRSSPAVLVRAIQRVARGETFVDPSIARNVGGPKLSGREDAVLRGVARGLALKEIAASLAVSVRSVETYRERAMEKLGLETRADVIQYAATHGWLPRA